jgi:hypothetical protein
MDKLVTKLKTGLNIKVKARSNETKLVQESNNFTMYVKSPPVDGKANREIIKFFSKKFKFQIKIIRGKTSSKKVLKLI